MKFHKHFGKNLDSLNQKEHHKKVSPKFTVCFSELASYMGIKMSPVEDTMLSTFDREQPSIIKEEEEHDDVDSQEQEKTTESE